MKAGHNEKGAMAENELIVASFYCKFFAGSVGGQQGSGSPPAAKPEVEDASTSRDFWVQDSWTDADIRGADELLRENIEKCAISALDRDDGIDDGEAWDRFYSNHGTRFFKDRHYLERAFPEDFTQSEKSVDKKTLVEIGCGVGNAILPMMEDEETMNQWETIHGIKKIRWEIIHGMDISQKAIALMKKDLRFVRANANHKAYGHVCDITQAAPVPCINSGDVATLLFCLSAIDPDLMRSAALHVASMLRSGGVLLFRDYGRFDEAQMKLGVSRNKQLKENFYRKHDGTKCYYFALDDVDKLFNSVGLRVLELEYIQRVYDNLKSGDKRRRVWVHGRFQKT